MDKLQMKEHCIRVIEENKDSIIAIGRNLYNNPELGFRELNSTELIANYLEELGLKVEKNIAVTGCRARINEHKKGPKIAILGELDAILCKNHKDSNENGAVHACGHNLQVASMAVLQVVDANFACIDPRVDATHHYERTHIDSLKNNIKLILEYLTK